VTCHLIPEVGVRPKPMDARECNRGVIVYRGDIVSEKKRQAGGEDCMLWKGREGAMSHVIPKLNKEQAE